LRNDFGSTRSESINDGVSVSELIERTSSCRTPISFPFRSRMMIAMSRRPWRWTEKRFSIRTSTRIWSTARAPTISQARKRRTRKKSDDRSGAAGLPGVLVVQSVVGLVGKAGAGDHDDILHLPVHRRDVGGDLVDLIGRHPRLPR